MSIGYQIQALRQFQDTYHELALDGDVVEGFNNTTKELLGYQYTVDPRFPFTSFKARDMNLDYIKKELEWYWRGDRHDASIGNTSHIWKKIIEKDGFAASNYGHQLFVSTGFRKAMNCLFYDKTSRRSVAYIGRPNLVDHLRADQPCTNHVQWLIREDVLYMVVSMRSQDAILGMTNDAAFFAFLYWAALHKLRAMYPDLRPARFRVDVASFHAYERHFPMLDELALRGEQGAYLVEWPFEQIPETEFWEWTQDRENYRD